MSAERFTVGYPKLPEEEVELGAIRSFDGVEYRLVEFETGGSFEFPYRETFEHAQLWRQRNTAAASRDYLEQLLLLVEDGMRHFHAEVCAVDKEEGKPCKHDVALASLREIVLSDPRLV